ELRALRDRGIVTPEGVSLVEAEKASRRAEIERLGITAGALRASRALMGSRPREALALAEEARALAPDQVDTWTLSADLLSGLGESQRAIALCREAVDVHGHVAFEARIAAYAAEERAGVRRSWRTARHSPGRRLPGETTIRRSPPLERCSGMPLCMPKPWRSRSAASPRSAVWTRPRPLASPFARSGPARRPTGPSGFAPSATAWRPRPVPCRKWCRRANPTSRLIHPGPASLPSCRF
ncbi:MAG: hypothetical protein WKF75_11240, partial [Singulisphaera sp.]